jgi:hypothetical protein
MGAGAVIRKKDGGTMQGRITRRILIPAAAVALLVGAVVVSPSGGSSPLSLSKAKKKFFTKAVATGLFAAKNDVYTKGQVYTKGESDGRFLPNNGEIRLNVPPGDWVAETGTANPPVYSALQAELTGGAANSFFSAPVQLPVTLLGRSATFTGMELCYKTIPTGVLDLVNVNVSTPTAADPNPGSITSVISDDTDRTDSTCRSYAPAAPVALGANTILQVQLRLDVNTGSEQITRTTVIIRL